MITEYELDQIYNEVEAERKLIEEKGFRHDEIPELVGDILKRFNHPAKDGILTQYITILWGSKHTGDWTICNDMQYRVIKKLSETEEKYFEKLIQKYCRIEKVDANEWKLRLKMK